MAQPFIIVPSTGSSQEDEWIKLGVEAQVAGNLPKAQQHYQQALRLNPRNAIATQNLAIVFAQSNLINEALLTIERASMWDGVHGVIQMNRALMCLEADRIEEALDAAKAGFAISPQMETRLALAMVYTTAGMPDLSIPLYNQILDEHPGHPSAGPNACFIQTLTTAGPAELRKQRERWHSANRYHGAKKPHQNDRTVDRPLRVGYVSGDFKCHSAAMIFKAVVCHHSAAIIPYLYSTLPVDEKADMKTKSFKEMAGEHWRDIDKLDDEHADELIRKDQIDILVDLAGHTNGGRLALFTRKPAPIQATAWGFAHGTGCPEIDYMLADPIAIPDEERQYYAEQIVDLPCIVSYDPPTEYQLTGTSVLSAYRNGYPTFGTYARYEKMSDLCLQTFAEILKRVPDAKLQFKDHAYRRPQAIKRIYSLMPDIAKDRLLFSISTTHDEHLKTYHQADLILDPFPHSGGVVCLEQLYMGVPMVTLYGTQAGGRTASSVLTAMGKMDWIAKTKEEYVEKAATMVQDLPKLAAIRKTLQAEFLASPVIKDYALAVEMIYRQMWKKWCHECS